MSVCQLNSVHLGMRVIRLMMFAGVDSVSYLYAELPAIRAAYGQVSMHWYHGIGVSDLSVLAGFRWVYFHIIDLSMLSRHLFL